MSNETTPEPPFNPLVRPTTLPPRRGRPWSFDPVKAALIVRLVRAGAAYSVAAKAAKIAPDTLKNWIEKGKRDRMGEFHEFYLDYIEAEAWGELELLGILREDATKNKNTASAKYLLEHRYRKRWSPEPRVVRSELSGPGGTPLQIESKVIHDDVERLERIEALKLLAMGRAQQALLAPIEDAVIEPDEEGDDDSDA